MRVNWQLVTLNGNFHFESQVLKAASRGVKLGGCISKLPLIILLFNSSARCTFSLMTNFVTASRISSPLQDSWDSSAKQ